MKYYLWSPVLLVAAASAAVAQPCSQSAGPQRARELVRQCIEVSPATHPPCNVQNSCELIQNEIRRGCGMLGGDSPDYCEQYEED